jgi:hypothetical protein
VRDIQNRELLGVRGKKDCKGFGILMHRPAVAIEEGFEASDVSVTRLGQNPQDRVFSGSEGEFARHESDAIYEARQGMPRRVRICCG